MGDRPVRHYRRHDAGARVAAALSRRGYGDAAILRRVPHPCKTFELLWAAYHLFLAGVPAERLLSYDERALLRDALRRGGVSLSPTFPIPDADDTAVALLMLYDLGEPVDCSVLQSFALGAVGTFA